jgi:hypothetical protein
MSRPVDDLIAALCSTTAELREECAALKALAESRSDDAESYRLLAQQAVTALHDEQESHARLRKQHYRLTDEYREHRARTLRALEHAA